MNIEIQTGEPLNGSSLERTREFLKQHFLDYEDDIEYTVNLIDEKQELVATASLAGSVIKCVAVSKDHRQEGIAAKLISHIVAYASLNGKHHLFLFTKPEHKDEFERLGFYEIIKTQQILFMENRKNGINDYIDSLDHGSLYGVHGSIVANCNPLTCGHLYLFETASKQCDVLHVFILSEDKSQFSADVRFKLVKDSTKHISNLILHKTSDYLISSATFPTYFIKDKNEKDKIHCELDLEIFGRIFATKMNISKRFVGMEPFCKVTAFYNNAMKEILPKYNIEVVEIPRIKMNDTEISASEVRKLISEKEIEKISKLVPPEVYHYIMNEYGAS